eukprot:scaffold266780_cov27-Attheya_sp.AAC.1
MSLMCPSIGLFALLLVIVGSTLQLSSQNPKEGEKDGRRLRVKISPRLHQSTSVTKASKTVVNLYRLPEEV